MLAEFNEVVHGVSESYRSEPAKVEAPAVESEQYDTDIMNTVRLVGMGVVINLIITLLTLGIVGYNL